MSRNRALSTAVLSSVGLAALMVGTLGMRAGAAPAGARYAAEPQGRTPQPVPSPNAPNQNYPQGMNGPGPHEDDKKTIDKHRQEEVKADVEKLYLLAGELREQIEKTDTADTLSLSVVKKAQQIEKLAKQVKEKAKG